MIRLSIHRMMIMAIYLMLSMIKLKRTRMGLGFSG